MSIQPVRVVGRIIEQVDRSDWPPLEVRLDLSEDGAETLRSYRVSTPDRYATPLHFWVHALRDERAVVGRRVDLVAAAGHAMCQLQSIEQWRSELEALTSGFPARVRSGLDPEMPCEGGCARDTAPVLAYRMLESPCRRSGVWNWGDHWMAYFWSHGFAQSWRCEVVR